MHELHFLNIKTNLKVGKNNLLLFQGSKYYMNLKGNQNLHKYFEMCIVCHGFRLTKQEVILGQF